MILHLKNISTNEIKRNVRYAGSDIAIPIVGMDENLQYYYEQVDQQPTFDSRTHSIARQETWTNEPHPTYTHILKMSVTWTLTQKSNEQIIEALTSVLGDYLDENYPMAIRLKHLKEGVELALLTPNKTDEQVARLTYITSLGDWLNVCRVERDDQEAALTNDGTLPTFQFTEKP
jgi:hypothetical protein